MTATTRPALRGAPRGRARLREAVWTAPDRIRMTTAEGRVFEVTVAPDGRPDRVAATGW
ncbi:hypothetical protein ACFV9E_35350 [Streptomyces sp. NPDC059835]|uniref:hypothetical protein n=1 Tax=Streptomyces sp. NPDC059835 TaxID=3346967 RepID=UPI003665869F